MPFASKAQAAYLYAKHPDVAKEFESKTSNYSKLPEKVKQTPLKTYSERKGK